MLTFVRTHAIRLFRPGEGLNRGEDLAAKSG